MKFVSIAIALLSTGLAQAAEPGLKVRPLLNELSEPTYQWVMNPPVWAVQIYRGAGKVNPPIAMPRCTPDTCAIYLLRDPIPPALVETTKSNLLKLAGGKTMFVSPQPDGSTKFIAPKQ